MRHVATKEGAQGAFGQSPFALARGHRFEFYALKDDAARLRERLEESGVLCSGSVSLADSGRRVRAQASMVTKPSGATQCIGVRRNQRRTQVGRRAASYREPRRGCL